MFSIQNLNTGVVKIVILKKKSVDYVAPWFRLHQIIKKPTLILENFCQCIYLIVKSQPSLSLDSRTHSPPKFLLSRFLHKALKTNLIFDSYSTIKIQIMITLVQQFIKRVKGQVLNYNKVALNIFSNLWFNYMWW